MKDKISVGLIGLGNVGYSVIHLFYKNKKLIELKSGVPLEFSIVCDIDRSKKSLLPDKNIQFTSSYKDIVLNPDIDIVVELIGGEDVAYDIIISSLKNGKHIVTANKAVLSQHWDKIFSLAAKVHKVVYFESSVSAGIPIIQSLNEGLASNRISRIIGILNGTTNYILSMMSNKNVSFNTALKFAQQHGFAETSPEIDIKGYDTTHKLSILSSIAYFRWIKPDDIYTEGIENIEVEDICYAKSLGYRIKLLGYAQIVKNDKFILEVRKYLVPENHIFANIEEEYNGILIEGTPCGKITFIGKGAGGGPASSAIMSDIIYVSRGIANSTIGKTPYVVYNSSLKVERVLVKEVEGCFYIKFVTVDRPGVLAKIASILGRHNVSIASVYQKEPLEKLRKGVPIIMLTHKTLEGNLISALEKIKNLPVILKKPVYMKILSE